MQGIGLFFYVPEVFCLVSFALYALLMGMQQECGLGVCVDIVCVSDKSRLWDMLRCFLLLLIPLGDGGHRFLSHSIYEEVGLAVHQDGWHESVVPIVVVCESAHGGFYATDDDGRVGEVLFEDA